MAFLIYLENIFSLVFVIISDENWHCCLLTFVCQFILINLLNFFDFLHCGKNQKRKLFKPVFFIACVQYMKACPQLWCYAIEGTMLLKLLYY